MLTDTRGIQIEAGDTVLCIGLHGHTDIIQVERSAPKTAFGKTEQGSPAKLTHDGVHAILARNGARDYAPELYILSGRAA
jgi:hypothetical protein